ncbi:MAG: proton-conducting transporter membrane subunit, partial [Gemmatimonadota bacterium]
ATMTLGNLACLWQDDIRRLLGWSAVSQTGYGLMAVVALGRSDLALPALLFFLAAYSLGNLAAFGVVIALRGLRARSDFAGLSRVRPGLSAALVVAFLSFVGIPPLAGFAAKLTLFAATIEAGYAWLAVLAVANTVVSLFYYARFMGPVYFEAPSGDRALLGWRPGFAVALCVIGLIVLGLGAELAFRAFGHAWLLPG